MLKGRCHCAEVSFTLAPPTQMFSHCHCESCRRTHGAAFVTWTSVTNAQLEIVTGSESIHRYESSPDIIWMSCSQCASPLFQTTRHSPGRTYVAVASLSTPMDRQPEAHVSFEEKVPWLTVNDGLPQHREKSSDLL